MKVAFFKDYDNPNTSRDTIESVIALVKNLKGVQILREEDHFMEMEVTEQTFHNLEFIEGLELGIVVKGGEKELLERLSPWIENW